MTVREMDSIEMDEYLIIARECSLKAWSNLRWAKEIADSPALKIILAEMIEQQHQIYTRLYAIQAEVTP
jgi:hypothetical protein